MPRLTHTSPSLPFAHNWMAGEFKRQECRIVYDGMSRNCGKGLSLTIGHEHSTCTSTRQHGDVSVLCGQKMPHQMTRLHLIKRRTRDCGTRRFSNAALDLIAPYIQCSRPPCSFALLSLSGLISHRVCCLLASFGPSPFISPSAS
ncbi:hypothetical protein CORC01_08045 [Colletotrichum orchidophilum]|uniref:Uncharacterized protein n=1 Tax=Colletotrichum orchidophilum TaxID=1209926 RepID=A0A1G4B5K6_9PEZI|nr:uncharacterized protein CORC01_08045 [Colletotrichum orchidophilum]OHE96728.1 hypothetical protein CORC01_08045 [Colletotrichum orchidophilum]